jgi:hypothetical protein
MSSLYDSPLTVYQTIAPAGSDWRYTFTFTNTDTLPIWLFVVYTDGSQIGGAQTPLSVLGRPAAWNAASNGSLSDVAPAYDPRNIVPSITTVAHTWTSDGPDGADALRPGETGTSFSLVASWYDEAPKFYAYDAGSNWAAVRGQANAYGWTGAAPGLPAFALVGAAPLLGGLLRRFWRK